MKNKQLIVSFYSHNLDWVNSINKDVDIIIYDKSSSATNYNKLENKGREPHTYFHHIIENYNNLPEWLILSQDGPLEHVPNWIEIINSEEDTWKEEATLAKDGAYFFTDYGKLLTCDQNGNPHHNGLPMVKIWDKIFNKSFPGEINFPPSCHLIVNKKTVLARSVEFYENIKLILETEELSPWVVERYMQLIFNCELL